MEIRSIWPKISRPENISPMQYTTSKYITGGIWMYSQMESVEPNLRFKSRSGLIVDTTGVTVHVESNDVYVHEVIITEGTGEGNKYLCNLDSAESL